MTAVAEDEVRLVAPGRRVRHWRIRLAAVVVVAVVAAGLSLWLSYQPLRFGSLSGGGDAQLGTGNPYADPAVLIKGPPGHTSTIYFSLRNDGPFAVTIDRVDLLPGLLDVTAVIQARGFDRGPVHFPDRIAGHAEAAYSLTVRLDQCLNPGGMTGFERALVHYHALGKARTAAVKLRGGVVVEGTAAHCPA